MWSTKHFYDESNLETFREEYAEMPIYRKVRENSVVTVGLVMLFMSLLVGGGYVFL